MPKLRDVNTTDIRDAIRLGCRTNSYLFFARPPVGKPVRVRFPWCQTELTLSERVHGHSIRVKLRGDAVQAMDNFGAEFTFFEPI